MVSYPLSRLELAERHRAFSLMGKSLTLEEGIFNIATTVCYHPLPRKVQLFTRKSEVAQSCPTLCDPMDCSLSGSSTHGIFQARVLEWAAIALLLYSKVTQLYIHILFLVLFLLQHHNFWRILGKYFQKNGASVCIFQDMYFSFFMFLNHCSHKGYVCRKSQH